jgi:hypothetical protein
MTKVRMDTMVIVLAAVVLVVLLSLTDSSAASCTISSGNTSCPLTCDRSTPSVTGGGINSMTSLTVPMYRTEAIIVAGNDNAGVGTYHSESPAFPISVIDGLAADCEANGLLVISATCSC